ncbi:MAG: MiaB/RimO family radical SAM methylthiotransferase [Chloroflexota bacterium]
MKIFLDTVGCRLNQSEIENYARQFTAAGHTLVPDSADADLTVVNTCTVTTAAAADSRKKIRRASRIGAGEVVATGCWATLEPQAAADLPGVIKVFSNIEKEGLVADILHLPPETFDLEPLVRVPVPGARLRTRAFIKVQDGCNNRCTFCITTVARGAARSLSVDSIISEVQAAVRSGAQEIVLTGVHLGSWGHDLESPLTLKTLIAEILKSTDLPRLRLSSLEPWDLDQDFFSLWADSRLAQHLHLPLQSGSAGTLRRMARKVTPESYALLIQAARAVMPDAAITTDLIVGFPGESEIEFNQSLDFTRQMDFADGHVFTYSERPGTAAALMPDPVPHPLRKTRNAQMRDVLGASSLSYRQKFIGQQRAVLWENVTKLGPQRWTLSGLTDNYLRVTAEAPRDLWNQITPVLLTVLNEGGILGQIP